MMTKFMNDDQKFTYESLCLWFHRSNGIYMTHSIVFSSCMSYMFLDRDID